MSRDASGLPRPFYSTVEGPDQLEMPRLLLISFHFPPGTAVGGLRWQQMSKYVVARGWGLDVVTRDPSALPARDEGRLRKLPPNVRVFAIPQPKPPLVGAPARAWKSLKRRVPTTTPRLTEELRRDQLKSQSLRKRASRAYLAWLDYVIYGALSRSAVGVAMQLAEQANYLAIATSGPPHMAHEAGRTVARAVGTPLILDFRDPWSLQERVGEHMASPVWFRLAEKYESRAVRDAAVIAMNTNASRNAMHAKYPDARDRTITVRNGCDDEPLPCVEKGTRFTIRFAGEIYIDRNPRVVFRAAARVVRDLRLTPREFGFEFIGLVDEFQGMPLQTIAQQEGLEGFVETGPYRPRDEALKFLAGAAMLLSLPQDSHLAIPAKVFEYLRFDAWLLILARPESATAQLLQGTNADVIGPDDVDRISDVILRRYEQFKGGELAQPVAAGGRFDRAHQANALLDRIAQAAAARK